MQKRPQPPHRRAAVHRRRQTPEIIEFCTTASSPVQLQYSPTQQACSHCHAFCNITWQTRKNPHVSIAAKQNNSPVVTTLRSTSNLRAGNELHSGEHPAGPNHTSKRPQPQQHHRRITLSLPASPAATTRPEKHSLSQQPVAITMRFATSRGKPACIYAHDNKTVQQSSALTLCSACGQRLQTPINYARTNKRIVHNTEHLVGPVGTNHAFKRLLTASRASCPSSPAAAPKKQSVLRSGCLPNTSPMMHSCSDNNVFCQHHVDAHAAIPICLHLLYFCVVHFSDVLLFDGLVIGV